MDTVDKNSNGTDSSLVELGDTMDTESDTTGAESDIEPANRGNNRNPDGTFIKGVSGNPSGRPKGTLKDYVRRKFMEMSDEEKEEWLKENKIQGIDQWEMGEGKPDTKGDLKIEVPDNLIELIKHGTANKGGDSKLPE